MATATDDLRERIEGLRGMPSLLRALEGLPPAYLVGGAVRDLLRGEPSVDLDVAIEGDAAAAAAKLAERLGGRAVVHERFGTASVLAPEVTLDLARTRRETYSSPGALPDVEPAGLAEDLARRDFTINALAAGLSGQDLGRLHDPHGGRRDLERGVVRVLHDRSFTDDPTRLLRALRYEARLPARLDPHTEGLARAAVDAGAPATVSGARVRDELLDLLREPSSQAALERMRALGLDEALHPALHVDAALAALATAAAGDVGADRVLAQLAALVSPATDALEGWVDELALTRAQRDRVRRAASAGPRLARELQSDLAPSRLHATLSGRPPEALALALALGASSDPILRYVRELRDVRPEVTGDDLVAAGIPPSPAIGRALAEVLRRKLDGEVSGRDDELRLALELAREQRCEER